MRRTPLTYAYKLTCVLPASPEAVYEAWLDSARHSRMTGAPAKIGAGVGAPYSAWDGYIEGKTIDLVPAKRIVQSWRTTDFAEDDRDSTIVIALEATDSGTLLTLFHSDVPEDRTGYENGGWQDFYFAPMEAYFARDSRKAKSKREDA